jgi:hypothetical protein
MKILQPSVVVIDRERERMGRRCRKSQKLGTRVVARRRFQIDAHRYSGIPLALPYA